MNNSWLVEIFQFIFEFVSLSFLSSKIIININTHHFSHIESQIEVTKFHFVFRIFQHFKSKKRIHDADLVSIQDQCTISSPLLRVDKKRKEIRAYKQGTKRVKTLIPSSNLWFRRWRDVRCLFQIISRKSRTVLDGMVVVKQFRGRDVLEFHCSRRSLPPSCLSSGFRLLYSVPVIPERRSNGEEGGSQYWRRSVITTKIHTRAGILLQRIERTKRNPSFFFFETAIPSFSFVISLV